MEQAKKHDHKIIITDIAINKIPLTEVPAFSEQQNHALQEIHRRLLKDAQQKNDSNEVAYALSHDFTNCVITYGSEHSVPLNQNIALTSLKKKLYPHELIIAHNHPSASNFSFADIAAFIFDGYIGLMTVVTNLGSVSILKKETSFSYDAAKTLFSELVQIHRLTEHGTESNQLLAADDFLKQCRKVGIYYARGK